MNKQAEAVGSLAGILGVLVCALSAGLRLQGKVYIGSYETLSLFIAGIAVLVFGCFLKLCAKS